jgi:hypothetical protein
MVSKSRILGFDLENSKTEDILLFKAELEIVSNHLGEQTPDWLNEKLDETNATYNHKVRAEMKRQLQLAKAKLEGLKTMDQKRSDLEAKIAALQKSLA